MSPEPSGEAPAITETGRLLVVDDEPGMRELLSVVLGKVGHAVTVAGDAPEALARLTADGPFDLVIQDLRMPGMDGIALLRELRSRDPEATVIVITAYSTWHSAVEAMRLGAFDYLRKPFDNRELRAVVGRALAARRRRRGPEQEEIWRRVASMIGHGPAMQDVFAVVRRVAPTDSTIAITGESGTGKELVARALHRASNRADRPFISVNCGAFVETLLESELFGHVRGAFTGAVADRKGLFEVATHGSLFLDEVGEMSPQTQVKLLRVLEERLVMPVGASTPRPVDVRIITATNKDLDQEVRTGSFREDLFYRLNVIPIRLPALRERRDDVPLLAGQFLARYARQMGKPVRGFAREALDALMTHDWPGNVRELENVVQRAVALAEGPEVTLATLAVGRGPRPAAPALARGEPHTEVPTGGMDLVAHLEQVEREYLERALGMTGGHATNAARLLGMSFRAFRYKCQKYGIRRDEGGA